MVTRRRQFLQRAASCATLLLTAPGTLLWSAPADARTRLLAKGLNFSDLSKLIGTSFFLFDPTTRSAGKVKLVAAVDLNSNADIEQFQLRFLGVVGLKLRVVSMTFRTGVDCRVSNSMLNPAKSIGAGNS